jgi:hypothetical protein
MPFEQYGLHKLFFAISDEFLVDLVDAESIKD